MTTSTIYKMRDLRIKAHTLSKAELPRALALHMLTTCLNGNIAVVCEDPVKLMNQVKKEWDKLSVGRSAYFRENISFSADSPFDDIQANVSFSTVEKYRLLPPICRTLYVTCKIKKEDMYLITSWMQPNALVVIYN